VSVYYFRKKVRVNQRRKVSERKEEPGCHDLILKAPTDGQKKKHTL
jgi:hypothetical protein